MYTVSIKDPIYDTINIYGEWEEWVVNSWPMQRLRYIKQLQLTYLVYPGANHTRFEHSLGVMHLSGVFADKVIDKVARNYENNRGFRRSEVYRDVYSTIASTQSKRRIARYAARMAGLLHDIGHGPLSHMFEERIINDILGVYGLGKSDIGISLDHETIGYHIYRLFLRDRLHRLVAEEFGRTDARVFIQLLDTMLEPADEAVRAAASGEREAAAAGLFLRMIIRDWIYPADTLDYLMRDSYYTGVESFGKIDYLRLINKAIPVPPHEEKALTPILAIDEKAEPNLFRFATARLQMYENVYYHPVVLAFNRELEKIFSNKKVLAEIFDLDPSILAKNRVGDDEILEYLRKYILLTDDVLRKKLFEICSIGWSRGFTVSCNGMSRVEEAVRNLFIYRKPSYRQVLSISIHLPPEKPSGKIDKERHRNLVIKGIKDYLGNHYDRDFVEDNIEVIIRSITFFPSSFSKIQGELLYLAHHYGHAIDYTETNVFNYARTHYLNNAMFLRIYVHREKAREYRERIDMNILAVRLSKLISSIQSKIIIGRVGNGIDAATREAIDKIAESVRLYTSPTVFESITM